MCKLLENIVGLQKNLSTLPLVCCIIFESNTTEVMYMNESLVDNEFIRNVIDKYSNTVFRVSYQYVRNRQDAEDVLQEVFVALVENLATADFQSDEHVKAWLIRVTINKSINLCKGNARRKRNEQTLTQEVRLDPQFDDLDYILSKLTAIDREIIYLRYYEGYSAREIAEFTDMTEQAVFKRLQRARSQLKEFISEEVK